MTSGKPDLEGAAAIAPVIAPEAEGLAFKPLYRQVREAFVRRMLEGAWLPGAPIPSEFQLAAELGVSQGTVRKALDEMAAENLLVRRQGRGTFVAEHDEQRILFRFFKLTPDEGPPRFPQSRVVEARADAAGDEEGAALGLAPAEQVARITRIRLIDEEPCIAETIVLPLARVPGLLDGPIPNNLYALYAARYGLTIARATEKLKAASLSAGDAALLGVAPGLPVLAIDRVGWSLKDEPVEWRRSRCLTDRLHYLSDLR